MEKKNFITIEEIVAYYEKNADPEVVERVAASILIDPETCAVMDCLASVESDVDGDDLTEDESIRFLAALRHGTESMIQETEALRALTHIARQEGGGLWHISSRLKDKILQNAVLGVEGIRVTLQNLKTAVYEFTLPCFAPAFAASALQARRLRETMVTAEGVRVEFQQLPLFASRLRVTVDASEINQKYAESRYNAVFITLEDSGASVQSPDRHILVVSLNEGGQGATDFTVGSGLPSLNAFPAPRNGCRLLGVTLSYIPPS